jgi:pilus assembly protein Flp/PilA
VAVNLHDVRARYRRFGGKSAAAGGGEVARDHDPRRPEPTMHLQKLLENEEGVTAIEYSLIAALIAVAIIVSVDSVCQAIIRTFNTVAGRMP